MEENSKMSILKEKGIIMRVVEFLNILLIIMIANLHLKIEGLGLLESVAMLTSVMVSIFLIKSLFLKSKYALLIIYISVFVISIFFAIEIINRLLYINESFYFMYDKMEGYGRLEFKEFRLSLTVINVLVIAVINEVVNIKNRKVLYVGNVIFVLWIYFNGGYVMIEKTIGVWCFLGLMYFMIEKIPKYDYKLDKMEKFGVAAFMIQVSVVISICIWFVPSDIYGHDFFGINGMVENKYAPSNASGVEYGDLFRYADSNIDGKKKLGGAIKQREDELLYLEGGYYKYLKAASRRSYDGEYWFNKSVKFEKMKKNTLMKDGFKKYKVIDKEQLTITHSDEMQTKTMFIPGLVSGFEINSKLYYSEISDCVLKGGSYATKYVVEKVVLANKDTGVEIQENFDDIKKIESGLFTYDKKSDLKLDYERYLNVPEEYSKRVIGLTQRIIREAKTPYEKIRAIRKYLKDEYPYTLEVGEVPEGEDFVEYFLFQEKKGYCTYFASAMAIMGRIAGVPTRYCEGFMVHENSLKGNDIYDKKYVVKGTNAHAWTEVLLDHKENIWVVVDATAEYVEEKNEVKEIADKKDAKMGEDKDFSINIGEREKERFKKDEFDNDKTKVNAGKPKYKFEFGVDTVVNIIIIIIIIKIVFYIRMKNINDPGRVFKYAIKRLVWIRIYRGKNETEKEFVQRLEDEKLREILDKMIYCAYERSYGLYKRYNSKEDFKIINKFLKKELGGFRYLLMKIWLY